MLCCLKVCKCTECTSGEQQSVRESIYGQWVDVLVDDQFPCLRDGSLAFCKAKRKQLWVPLIEKALAKLHGSYGALTSGTTQEGLAILTGFSCESYDFETLEMSEALSEEHDLLWARLLSSVEPGLLMGCSCGRRSMTEEEFSRVGLVRNHAYSILDVKFVQGERLIRLRNTWGKFSWTGNWCEYSECWNLVPENERNKLMTKGAADGLFWISFTDWLKYFNAVYICFVREGWHETRVRGVFPNGHSEKLTVSRLAIFDRSEVDLSLHQQSSRGHKTRDIVDLLLLVFDDRWRLVAHNNRKLRNHVTCSTILEPGYYTVYCLSFTQWQVKKPIEYTLACHSHHAIYMEDIDLPVENIAMALIQFALKKGVPAMCDSLGSMYTYTLNKGWSGQLTLAVNNNPVNFLHIKSDLTQSVNLVSTRGVCTIDVIPPRHRQIINISTQLETTASYSLRCKQSFLSSHIPQPGRWGASSTHTPNITPLTKSIHSPIPSHYF
ncbi:CAPN15 [Bugula neritina]|uniref:CAPN15 n=1 Tax=Bugula neritina TaxID=10212 RepID=A0A7J7KPA9_BUGNE|nr:CAPN15 [Bugula neritina]